MYPRLREIREAKKLTQKQVANYLRISQNTYSQYETGTRKLPVTVLCRLAEFYRTARIICSAEPMKKTSSAVLIFPFTY